MQVCLLRLQEALCDVFSQETRLHDAVQSFPNYNDLKPILAESTELYNSAVRHKLHVIYKSFSAITSLDILGAVTGREVHLVLHLLANVYSYLIDVPF